MRMSCYLVPVALLLSASVLCSAQESPEIGDYLLGVPPGATAVMGLTIRSFTTDEDGAVLSLGTSDAPVTVRLIGPVATAELLEALESARSANILPGSYSSPTGEWSLNIDALDVSAGYGDAYLLVPDITLHSVRLSREARLDFSRKLLRPPEFIFSSESQEMTYAMELEEIDADLGTFEAFPGWQAVSAALLAWAQAGLDANDQQVMGTILEIRILTQEELVVEKQVVVTGEADPWGFLGIAADAFLPDLLVFSGDGVFMGLRSVVAQALFYLEWDDMGPNPEIRPFRPIVALGPFVDLNLYCRSNCDDPETNDWIGYGPAVAFGVSTVIPRVQGNRLTEPTLGIAFELQTRINVATLIARAGEDNQKRPLTEGEYYFTINPLVILQPCYRSRLRPEFFLGPSFRVLPDFNEDGMSLYSMTVGIGARVRFEVMELIRSPEGENLGP